jgi:hypothetical protein
MGGPWRDRRFDPSTWRTPVAARGPGRIETAGSGVPDPLTGIVIGYVAAALTSVGMLLILLRNGW